MFERVVPGLYGELSLVVGPENTAAHLGSGKAQVLATPEMVRLMEQAAVAAVDPLLPEGHQTVGVQLDVRHVAATPPGMRVTARARLVAVEGRLLTFAVEAHDAIEKVGEGTHQRMIINVARFEQRVEAKRRHEATIECERRSEGV